MPEKIAIVTGSSSGFGLLTVIELALKDFMVIATMRDLNKAAPLWDLAKEKKVEKNIQVYTLDVTSIESINQFKGLLTRLSSLDVLVNNAGFAIGGFSEEISIEDYRRQFETNFFGVIAVTQAVLPFMREKGKGRIINLSSISGRIGFPGLSAYVSSKHALEGYSESLRLEIKPFGIDVSLVEPGSYRTSIWTSVDQLEVKNDSPYFSYMGGLLNELETGKAQHGNPIDVAKLVAKIASQPKSPKLRYPIGRGVKNMIVLKNMISWEWIEAVILRKLKP